jgi:hypothetical protein
MERFWIPVPKIIEQPDGQLVSTAPSPAHPGTD